MKLTTFCCTIRRCQYQRWETSQGEKMMIRKYTIGFNCVDAVCITSLKNTGQNYL